MENRPNVKKSLRNAFFKIIKPEDSVVNVMKDDKVRIVIFLSVILDVFMVLALARIHARV